MSQSIRFKVILPLVILAVGVIALVLMLKLKPQAQRQQPPAPRPVVTIHTVEPGADAIRVRGFGSVQAKRSVNLTPQVSGEIVEKSPDFEPGAYCRAGQVLLRVDDTDYALAAAKAEADVAQAEYNLARAEEEAQVARREWQRIGAEGVIGTEAPGEEPTALVLHEPQLKLARAQLASAKAALRQAQVNLDRCTLTAPFDGRVLSADVDAGQYLRAGNAVGSIYATDVAEVTVSVPDDELAWIAVEGVPCPAGSATTVDVSADFAGSRHTWQGKAVRLGGAVDARSRMVPVVVEIIDPYRMVGDRPPLIEGMFVEVTFTGQPPADAVVIPRSALRPGDQVWVVDGEQQINVRDVIVARAGVDEAVIQAGLEPGERVVTSNLQYVTDGLPVRIEGQPLPREGQGEAATAETAAAGAKDGQ